MLLLKLKRYCLGSSALALLQNYFLCRTQIVKGDNTWSSACEIKLGVPQGSVLGPLFFSIFINDLPYALDLNSKLFADDTTLYETFDLKTRTFDTVVRDFKDKLSLFTNWCIFNRLDINWTKTHFMVVSSNNKILLPDFIKIENHDITLVDEFKLLGFYVDNKLNFLKHISYLVKKVNPKLYLFKKLFYLSLSVKIQFFKSFILPYFDYCSTLIIYFPKYVIQKLHTFYYTCIYKLFGFSFHKKSADEVELFLKKYKLFSLEYRLFTRLGHYLHKVLVSELSPPGLKSLLAEKSCSRTYNLRATDRFIVPKMNNHFGDATFINFFSRLANYVLHDLIDLSEGDFDIILRKNVVLKFFVFRKHFDMLTLEFCVSPSNTFI